MQITRTTPFRLMILQLEQIFFTDALTFIYFFLYVILPLERSYGDNSTVTLSPGRIRM